MCVSADEIVDTQSENRKIKSPAFYVRIYVVQAFQDLVETKKAAPGKVDTPLANAENVAMLQVSGTLANR